MEVTFLGTGTSQGVPVIACGCEVCRSGDPRDNRLRTSVLLEVDQQTIVIDTGPDFRQQMLREKVQYLDGVLFTHAHKDHIAGLDDVRGFNYMHGKAMPVYASEIVQKAIKREYPYAFGKQKYPGVPRFDLRTICNRPFDIGPTTFTPIEVLHYKLPVFGFRVYDFTYITDANYIGEEEKKKIEGSKVLVLNALRKEDHLSHFTLQEAIDLFKELRPEQGYITHISHQMGRHAQVSQELPEFVDLAFDGLKISL